MYDVCGSIVVFKNNKNVLAKAIASFLDTGLKTYLYVVDNSPKDGLRNICSYKNVEYIFNNHNLGFGAGHNIALHKSMARSKYSLILNPDVYFSKGTLEKLFNFMEIRNEIGLIMPKVLYPDGSLQYVCRLLPSPYDMLLRKINIRVLNTSINPKKIRYELKSADYSKQMDVPYLSGCFMFIRTSIFEKIGIFDERFFVYFEDIDLARRIHKLYRTVYYPEAVIYHSYERDSNNEVVLLKHLISSGVKYFNKWGWFFDKEREEVNREALRSILRIPKN